MSTARMINLDKPLSFKEKLILHDFLLANPDIILFERSKIWTINGIAFTLSHHLERRQKELKYGKDNIGILTKYDVLKIINQGGFGVIHACIKKLTLTPHSLMEETDHNHIVKLTARSNRYERYLFDGHSIKNTTETEARTEMQNQQLDNRARPKNFQKITRRNGTLYLTTSRFFKGQTLNAFIEAIKNSKSSSITRDTMACLRYQLSIALIQAYQEQIGNHNYSHRDIKPGNIMINTPPMTINFFDFAMAIPLDTQTHSLGGTILYIHPDLIKLTALSTTPLVYTRNADIYSLGISLAELWGTTGLAKLHSSLILQHPELPIKFVMRSTLLHDPENRIRSIILSMLLTHINKPLSLEYFISAFYQLYIRVKFKERDNEFYRKAEHYFHVGRQFRKQMKAMRNKDCTADFFNQQLDSFQLGFNNNPEYLACYIQEFAHGSGWHLLLTSLIEAQQRIARLFKQRDRIVKKYTALIGLAETALGEADSEAERQAIFPLIASLNALLERFAEKPFDLNDFISSINKMQRKYIARRLQLIKASASNKQDFINGIKLVLDEINEGEDTSTMRTALAEILGLHQQTLVIDLENILCTHDELLESYAIILDKEDRRLAEQPDIRKHPDFNYYLENMYLPIKNKYNKLVLMEKSFDIDAMRNASTDIKFAKLDKYITNSSAAFLFQAAPSQEQNEEQPCYPEHIISP